MHNNIRKPQTFVAADDEMDDNDDDDGTFIPLTL